jgi:hypothetical protein
MKIANRDARQYVQRQHPFTGNNLYATFWCANPSSTDPGDNGYAVFSYGAHWPLFVCVNGVWYENEDRRSRTTSKHRSQTHPHVDTVPASTEWLIRLIRKGYTAVARDRVIEGV